MKKRNKIVTSKKTGQGESIWALVVGINEYKAPPSELSTLSGCVNDARALRDLLINQMDVPERQIKVLTDQDATRAGILREFQDFLIGNPEVPPGSQILFHFSGHGSQMPTRGKTEPDALDETIVPHDSRTQGVFDIPDKTLAALLDRLAANKGDNITVILDCCHSGSGTRKVGGAGNALSRRAKADERKPPSDLDAELRVGTVTRSGGPSGPSRWTRPRASHVLLAGCRDREESKEYLTPGGEWHGALTWFTLEYLKQLPPNTSYVDLHEDVASKVNAIYRDQMPQCEGERDRLIFGGAHVERDPFITVTGIKTQTITLGAGFLTPGLAEGAQLAIYPPGVKTKAELPNKPLATAEITSAFATTAQARVLDGQIGIPLNARAVITDPAYGGIRKRVALQAGKSKTDQAAVKALRQAIQASPFLELTRSGGDSADLRVIAADGKLMICGADGAPLVTPEDLREKNADAVAGALRALESIARFHILQGVSNQNAKSKIQGTIKLRLRRYVGEEGSKPLPKEARDEGGELTLLYEPEHEDRNQYVVEVINESAVEVYPHLFLLNPDYSIVRLYPNHGQKELLRPKGEVSVGLKGSGDEPLSIYLPDEPRWESSRDQLKVIVTTKEGNLKTLEQGGLEVPPQTRGKGRKGQSQFGQLLDSVMQGNRTRFGGSGSQQKLAQEDWGAAVLPYRVVRASQTTRLSAAKSEIEIGGGIVLKKPKGFSGEIAVNTIGAPAKRGGAALQPPPGLVRLESVFQPLDMPGARSAGSTALVITLATDEASRQTITAQNPLRLQLSGPADGEVTELLPIAFDGQDYLLAGAASGDLRAVDVTWLPKPAAPMDDGEGAPAKRGVWNTIKLFVFKKMGRYTPQLGLRRAEVVNGEVEYSAVRPDQFKAGDTVALFVHGFTSDTRWMARDVGAFLRAEVLPYKHILTFDHESFGTGVAESGEDLALALRQQCGFGAKDKITLHVYAHSMGSLVSRCMIELSGGYAFVDRLVIAGPPNNGTTLATLSRGSLFLFNALLNGLGEGTPLAAMGWLIEQFCEQSAGVADLAVRSEITRKLNALDAPSNVSYLALAGENRVDSGSEQKSRLHRLGAKVLDRSLDLVFGEKNDGVIGMSSMKAVRNGVYPKRTVKPLSCDHFSYYSDSNAQAIIKDWIRRKL